MLSAPIEKGAKKGKGLVNEFKPWYYDGKSVWWGTLYPLRSDAEAAALKLQKQMIIYKIKKAIKANNPFLSHKSLSKRFY